MNKKGETINDIVQRIAADYLIFGAFALQIIRNRIGEIAEIYWIDYYNAYHNGYNATLGGDGTPYFDHSLILNRLREYPYPIEIAKEIGCSSDLVRAIAKRNNITVKNL